MEIKEMVKAKETVAKDSFAYLMALARVRSYNDNGKLLSNYMRYAIRFSLFVRFLDTTAISGPTTTEITITEPTTCGQPSVRSLEYDGN